MATVVYDGPEGQVNRDLGAETGDGDIVVPGRRYRVSAALADRLVASNVYWRKITRRAVTEAEAEEGSTDA